MKTSVLKYFCLFILGISASIFGQNYSINLDGNDQYINLGYSEHFDLSDATKNPIAVPVFTEPGDVIIFSEGMTHNAYPVTNRSVRRSVFFNYIPAIRANNLPQQRMSIYPDHVLHRLSDLHDILTTPGYI